MLARYPGLADAKPLGEASPFDQPGRTGLGQAVRLREPWCVGRQGRGCGLVDDRVGEERTGTPGVAVVAVAAATTWTALLGLGFLVPALPALRTVLTGATGRALVPVLQQTGTAELVWSMLVAVPLLLA